MLEPNNGQGSLPHIDCVIIGVNAAATLERCLTSIQSCSYPQDRLHIYYVDGGSTDASLAIARRMAGIPTLALNPEFPTPGLGRNAGWRAGDSPLIQFLDSDTILHPDWLKRGIMALSADYAAVKGNRCEIYPERSVYNWIASLEWNGPAGDAECFGGDVLVRREVLVATGGYDEALVGGEDPELSRRIRLAGGQILQLDTDMTMHDLAMTGVRQYWKRAYRSGYAFAAVIDRFAQEKNPFWGKEFRRILVRGGGSLGLLGLALILGVATPISLGTVLGLAVLGLGLLLFPRIFRVEYFRCDKHISHAQARTYAWHCSLVVIPDICGVARYYFGKALNRPLRNRRNRLATATLTS